MELKYLELFYKVVELKSFSKAAAALFLTQPTISNHIKALEDDMGVKLLDRLGRTVVPTRAGEVLYRYAKEIVNLKENMEQALNEFKGNVKGKLVIGGSTIPGEYILPEYIAGFKTTRPDVSMTLKLGDTQDIIAMVMDGTVELGVVGSRPDDKRVACREFLEDELILVSSPQYSRNIKKQLDVRDLKGLSFIMREKGSGSRKTLEETLKNNGINIEDIDIAVEVGSTEAAKQAVNAGLGVSFLSRFAVKRELSLKTLIEVPVKHFGIKRHFYIINDRARAISPICQSFINNLLANQ